MMNVLKNPTFFRPMSRPSSPAPATAPSPPPSRPDYTIERASRPLNKLSLSNFRRQSPAPSAAPTAIQTLLIQDGSYLEMLSLKLSEAVSKALAQPTGLAAGNDQISGKRPIPQGRGHVLGALIASELRATQTSPHLQRAIRRSLHRPLSVMLTNLSAHLLPLISSPAFRVPPSPTLQAPNPNPTQLHALAIATFAGEVLETFDIFDLGMDPDPRGDGLKAIRDGLVSTINRVVGPLVAGIRVELMPLLEALELPALPQAQKPGTGKQGGGTVAYHHPSIIALQAVMPIYARALTRYTTSTVSQTILATFLISVIWRGLVALAHRPYVPPSPPASPTLLPVAIKRSRSSATPPITPPAGRFTIKLPPSRPPSPPLAPVPATTAADARALYDLFTILPSPPKDKDATRLAREVVDDALEGLKALPPLLDAVHALTSNGPNKGIDETAQELELLATEVPLLIAIPILLQIHGRSADLSVTQILGLSDAEYRKECLFGFGRAEECATLVAQRIRDVLRATSEANPIVCRWLDMEIAEALGQ